MKIPTNALEQMLWYAELARKCLASRDDRRKKYELWRQYYMYGQGPNEEQMTDAPFNKIYPHLDTLTSFLYAQDTTKFSVNIGASVSDIEYDRVPSLNRKVNDEWMNSNTDTVFGSGLNWSLVYGSTFIKPRWKVNGIEPFVVEPHNFGVLREDTPGLWQQEAYCHTYCMTKSQLRNELDDAQHPGRAEILKKIEPAPKNYDSGLGGMYNIVTSASSPNVVGNVNIQLANANLYTPEIAEDVIEMTELYVYDDAIKDFRVVTMAEPYVVIYDRPITTMFLKNEAPFVQICPIPAHDYFWGLSEVERLIPLQKMRNRRMAQIAHLLELQAQPPKAASGFPAGIDELIAALDSPNGVISTDMPGAKVDTLSPNIPDDLFKEIDRIDQFFEDMSGIGNVLQGKGESGVRSTGHASQLLRSGSSRPKKRALIIEDSLEKLATLYLQIIKKYDDRRLKDTKGIEFVPHQFTDDFIVKVDGHSNSPIFMEDQTQIAFELFKVKAIDRESLLRMLPALPMRDMLIQILKKEIEPAEQKAAQAQMAQEEKMEKLKLVAHSGKQ